MADLLQAVSLHFFQWRRAKLTIEGHRLYTPRECLDCFLRNIWTAIQALVIGHPGLDPEQDGSRWRLTRFDAATLILLPFVCIGWWRLYGSWTVVLFFLSPVLPAMSLEMGNEKERGPRVWLSRWYLGMLPLVSFYARFPTWWQLLTLFLWLAMSWGVSGFYRSAEANYKQWLAENPNPDHYRLTALAFEYLRQGKQSQAEDEYQRALDYDPSNARASIMTAQFALNRTYHERGYIGLGFTCQHCHYRDMAFFTDGDQLSREQYRMYIDRVCSLCGKHSESSII